jgi:hypothetical protein
MQLVYNYDNTCGILHSYLGLVSKKIFPKEHVEIIDFQDQHHDPCKNFSLFLKHFGELTNILLVFFMSSILSWVEKYLAYYVHSSGCKTAI